MNKPARKPPAWWVPSLYFAEGLPFNTVTLVSAVMYKNMGLPNDVIAWHTGLLYLPWTIKPFWAPLTEMWKTKRHWVLGTQVLMALTLGCVALALPLPSFMPLTLAFFWVTAFLSSTHDIAADGLYINVMSHKEQSKWAGVQGIFWDGARLLATGPLVAASGLLYDRSGSWVSAWVTILAIIAVLMLVLSGWHLKVLPQDSRAVDTPRTFRQAAATFWDTLRTFFAKPGIWGMIIFIVLFRSGEGFLEKMGPLFMMDGDVAGGLGLTNQSLGNLNTYGTAAFAVGALVGGFTVARWTLERTLFVLCLALNVPNLTFVYLSYAMPQDLWVVGFWVIVEKFGYGIGSVGHMLYMMQQLAPGRYPTAHYAFGTALMALGLMIPSSISGDVQMAMGYKSFFVFVLFASVPSLVATWFAPFRIKDGQPVRA